MVVAACLRVLNGLERGLKTVLFTQARRSSDRILDVLVIIIRPVEKPIQLRKELVGRRR